MKKEGHVSALHRPPSPTARSSMRTTQYTPGRGVTATNDLLLVKAPVGRAPKSLQTLLPEDRAYGISVKNDGIGTRETMHWQEFQSAKPTDADQKHLFPPDIVKMNTQAIVHGHIHPASHYKYRSDHPLWQQPPPSIHHNGKIHITNPQALPASGLTLVRDTSTMDGIMAHRYAEAYNEKLRLEHDASRHQFAKPHRKHHASSPARLKSKRKADDQHTQHAQSPQEFVKMNPDNLWKMPQFQDVNHRVSTHWSQDEQKLIDQVKAAPIYGKPLRNQI